MSDHDPEKPPEKRALRSPVNRMIDEEEDEMMQRDADPRRLKALEKALEKAGNRGNKAKGDMV